MIEPTGAVGMSMQPASRPQAGSSLTEDQTQFINHTLSQFDAKYLSKEDTLSIVTSFQDVGIQAGKVLGEVMAAAGFDAKSVGDLAGAQGKPPGGASKVQGSGVSLSEDVLRDLYALLDQYYSDDTSETDKASLGDTIYRLLGAESNIFSATA